MRCVFALLLLAALAPCAAALEPLPDSALAKVAGRDGMSFNLSNFAMSGTTMLRYYAPNGDSVGIGRLALSRSDNSASPFADPYRLDVVGGGPGRADIVDIAMPQNAAGLEKWQAAFDLDVDAGGIDVSGGSVILKDLVYYAGGVQFSTPAVGDGLAFGLSTRFTLGSLTIAPNGRADTADALVLSNVRVGAATGDGSAPTAPWVIASVANQAGIFNARTDEAGNASLHIGIGWPAAGQEAPSGTLQIGNISFRSDAGTSLDLGSARIGAIQLNYLDVKFH